jgi:hypothetical protein
MPRGNDHVKGQAYPAMLVKASLFDLKRGHTG